MSRPQNNVENNHGQKKAIWVLKSQNDPKIKTELNVRIAGHQENKRLYMSSNDLKIRSKLKARIEGNIEKKCSSAI